MSLNLSVFVDEAGDPGTRDGLKYLPSRHEWFCIAAVVTRTVRIPDIDQWLHELREVANCRQAASLHYHRINIDRRENVCRKFATKPCRAFIVASHKSNMRSYTNVRLNSAVGGETFYNWCLRLLLERVTAWSADWLRRKQIPVQALQVVLAQRGHDYDHLFAYIDRLRMQKSSGTLLLKGPGLAPETLDRTHWTVERAADSAGLQLADVAASAFYQGVNTASPSWDIKPAVALTPLLPKRLGSAANFGVTLFPLPHQAKVPKRSEEIFRSFGYSFPE